MKLYIIEILIYSSKNIQENEIIKQNQPFDFYRKAIICETEEEANLLLAIASSKGYKWRSGQPFSDHTAWYNHDVNGLVYYISSGQYGYVHLIDKLIYEIVYFKDIKEQLKK